MPTSDKSIDKNIPTKEDIAQLLKTSDNLEEALQKFEETFQTSSENEIDEDLNVENSLDPKDAAKSSKISETVENDVDEDSDDEDEPSVFLTTRKLIVFSIMMLVLLPALGFGGGYLFKHSKSLSEAVEGLDNLSSQRGSIMVLNTELVTFKGQAIPSADIDQKALVSGFIGSESAVYAFSNGKTSETKKTLEVYLDFNSARSRDFMLFNQSSLKGMVENNLIELRVHPVPTGSAYSIYAAEALAESVLLSPEKTWELMFELLKASSSLNNNSDEDIVTSVVETSEEVGITGITVSTIKNGTFASWVLAVGDDPKLSSGYYPPVVYLDGIQVTPEDVFFNDPDAFQRYILRKE